MMDFIAQYMDAISKAMGQMDVNVFEKIITVLRDAGQKGKRIFVIGNGGSAATASHFMCDLGKNTALGNNRFKAISLSESVSYISAYGNDVGFESVFAEQLRNLLESGDLLIAISASGNSPNIIQAAEFAIENGGTVIGLTGFNGGRLKELANLSLNIPLDTYEQIEDVHLILCHLIVCAFKRNQRNKEAEEYAGAN